MASPRRDYKNNNIVILENEYLCDECNGWGKVTGDGIDSFYAECPKCLGDCRLNWIENIVGKREENRRGRSWRPRASVGIIIDPADGKRVR